MFDSLFPKHWTTLQRLMWLKTNALARAVYEIVTGNPVSFTAKAAPLRKLQIAFSPVQTGSGDPSPDNVRPISGWDSLTVEQRGKNLFGGEIVDMAYGIFVDGNKIVVGPAYRGFYAKVKGGQTYTISRKSAESNRFRIAATIEEPAPGVLCNILNSADSAYSVIVNVPNGYNYVFVYLSNQSDNCNANNYQIELGTATAYVPYNPSSRSISISLGSTVYSGWVDAVTGIGEIDKASFVADGSEGWSGGSASTNWRWRRRNDLSPPAYNVTNQTEAEESISERFAPKWSVHQDGRNDIGFLVKNLSLFVRFGSDIDLTTEQAVKDYFAANPTRFVYPLATPIPIQLTPQEINSLAGDNVMWSNANGDLTITYRSN